MTAGPSTSVEPSSSSWKEAAIGAGVGVPLGVALLGALALLWRQRAHEQTLKKKIEEWERTYDALVQVKSGGYRQFTGASGAPARSDTIATSATNATGRASELEAS